MQAKGYADAKPQTAQKRRLLNDDRAGGRRIADLLEQHMNSMLLSLDEYLI
jgi:hypothetical protein